MMVAGLSVLLFGVIRRWFSASDWAGGLRLWPALMLVVCYRFTCLFALVVG